MPADHIVLCGPSGAGKSTVGPLVARALGRPFVDIDTRVETLAGMTIPQLFAAGEERFRAYERRAVAEALAGGTPTVVALGGGSLLDPASSEAVMAHQLVYLDAPLGVLVKRTAGGGRPLVQGTDRVAVLRALLDVRRPGYERARVRVDAGGGAATVAQRVLAALAVVR